MKTEQLLKMIPPGVYAPLAMPAEYYCEPIAKMPKDDQERARKAMAVRDAIIARNASKGKHEGS